MISLSTDTDEVRNLHSFPHEQFWFLLYTRYTSRPLTICEFLRAVFLKNFSTIIMVDWQDFVVFLSKQTAAYKRLSFSCRQESKDVRQQRF